MQNQTVVLIHGLWMVGLEMSLLRYRLRRRGYRVLQFRYPTVSQGMAEHRQQLACFLQQHTTPAETVHLVGHSLGGLVALDWLHHARSTTPLGRVIALGSPFQGSWIAQHIARWCRPFRSLLGHSMAQALDGHGHRAVPHGHTFGVVAGTFSWGICWFIPGLPQPNDGLVAVTETQLAGTSARLSCHVSHLGLVLSRHVAQQIHHFLEQGCFYV